MLPFCSPVSGSVLLYVRALVSQRPMNSVRFAGPIKKGFIQENVERNVKQNEELSKRAIPGVIKYLAALRYAHGGYLVAR
jgi:hypothetical protein